jgi:AraC-like DNA-binding protein
MDLGDLLFAEYTCPLEDKRFGLWTQTDFLVHVVSGKKIWHTTNGSYSAESGQTLYFKKGAAIVEQFFDVDFCLLLFFIPDDFVRNSVKELASELKSIKENVVTKESAMRINNDAALSVYFQSMRAFFAKVEKPSEHLLRLKLKELIMSILLSRNNPELSSYFRSLVNNTAPGIGEIMEANFRYNLSLENYAELCHRSLSSFKRDFQKKYNESPGSWLLNKRLDYAAVLLRTNGMNISQIMFESGFENLSHFSRTFKDKFGVSPVKFREQVIQ